jgi:tetratricopeptide (TPR) repeat protein/tRNA A-37 threonylcarbamoyl transferase component Bud32
LKTAPDYSALTVGNALVSAKPSLATQVAQAVAQNNPDSPAAQSTYGQWALKDGMYQDALAATTKAMKLGDASPATLTAYAGANYGLGNFPEARKAAGFALKEEPSNRTAESIYKLSEGKAPQAKLPSVMDRLDRKTPQSAREALLSADRIGAADIAAALPAGAEGLAVMPTGAKAASPAARQSAQTSRQAAAKLQVKDYAGAKELADKAIVQNPDNAQAYAYRSMANNRLGDYPAALKDADASLRLVPENTPSLLSRALANNRMKEYPPALEDSESVLEREPRNSLAYLMKAYAEAGLDRDEDMRASLEKAAAFSPAYQVIYERALQAPKSEDALFLFEGDLLPGAAQVPAPKNRMPWWPFALAGGAGLLALGFLRKRQGDSVVVAGAEAAEEPSQTTSGTLTGFEILRPIGAGGMGEVFEGRDVALDRRVAIKRMREEIRRDPRERERFLSEARLVAKLRHPAIVEIHSVVEAGEDVYLVFEFVDGKTATALLAEKKRLPFAEARRIVSEACGAVDYAHAQGVIHRDLKPSNIMLDASGAVKVMDFGIARQAAEAMSRVAMTNTVVGTPPYMAPEQEQGAVCKESDVYALGICLYELLSGELPFSGSGAGMLMAKMEGRFVPLSVPPGIDAVMAKALAPKPAERYRMAGELADALAEL